MFSAVRPAIRTPALRQAAARRFESTASQKASEAAKEGSAKAKEYQAKAAEGLSRVTSAAGPAVAGFAKGLGGTLSKVGGRTGKVVAFVEKQTPFVVYWSKVALETGKLVARGQKMSPPSVGTMQAYYQNLWSSLKTNAASPQNLLSSVRNISNAQLAAGGVVLAECVGFFTVGEMIGRFKVVGYHGEVESHH